MQNQNPSETSQLLGLLYRKSLAECFALPRTAGLAKNADGTAYVDFDANGTDPFLAIGPDSTRADGTTGPAVEIRADGTGYFARVIISPPQILEQGTVTYRYTAMYGYDENNNRYLSGYSTSIFSGSEPAGYIDHDWVGNVFSSTNINRVYQGYARIVDFSASANSFAYNMFVTSGVMSMPYFVETGVGGHIASRIYPTFSVGGFTGEVSSFTVTIAWCLVAG